MVLRSLCVVVLVALGIPALTWAQTYPAKPVRIMVGFAAGGGIDITSRLYALRLTEALGQSFVVDNRPGAAGSIATDLVAKAPPDGYTLIMVSVTHAINPSLYANLPYDTVKSFAPVSPVARMADVVAVHPSVPVKDLRTLLDLAKRRPGDVIYAHAGAGTLMHVGMELMLTAAGVKMLGVPYKGSAPSTAAVVGGEVPVLSTSLPPSLPHARAGRLRILAVTTAERTPLAPEYPTVAEAAGLKGYEAVVWVGLLAPAGTPAAVIDRLNAAIGQLQQKEETRAALARQSTDPFHASPAGFAELLREDVAKYGRIARDIGLKAQ